MNKKKTLFILLIIVSIFFLIVGAGLFLYQRKSTDDVPMAAETEFTVLPLEDSVCNQTVDSFEFHSLSIRKSETGYEISGYIILPEDRPQSVQGFLFQFIDSNGKEIESIEYEIDDSYPLVEIIIHTNKKLDDTKDIHISVLYENS